MKQESPSDRITFSLIALEEAEKSNIYTVDMNSFHGQRSGKCLACLGGAAAIKRWIPEGLQIAIYYREEIEEQAQDISLVGIAEYEYSLDSARIGDIATMFYHMKLNIEDGRKFNRTVCRYQDSPEQFKEEMRALAADLKAAGY